MTTIYGRHINIQPNFYDVVFDNASAKTNKSLSNMKAVGMVALICWFALFLLGIKFIMFIFNIYKVNLTKNF